MNFDLTDEQKAIASLARDFAQNEVKPRAEQMDRDEAFPYDLVGKMAELGFMGLPFPEEYGGAGADTVSYALAVMEIARADASTAITLAAHVSLGATPFFLFGSDEQKQKYLVPLAQGTMLWGFGLTEPNAGSDAGNLQTKAELRDGMWVVNGTKAFITNSGTEISGGTTITAITGTRPDGSREISNIIVPQATPGFTRSRKYRKMGWRASDTRELSFVDAQVPQESILGPRGEGYKQFLSILDGGRISVAALSIGLAMGAYDEALAYAKERQAFGKPISKFQAISFKLVDMLTEIEHAKLMMLKAAWEKDQGRDYVRDASFAKLFSGELSHRVVNDALQIHGGYGFMDEYPISRMYRDQKINEIGEGTNEVQRLILARLMGDIERITVMVVRLLATVALVSLALIAPASAALSIGTKAPQFTLPATQGGNVFTFDLDAALKKGPVVLYFYPAAFTPGCTIEAHEFADATDQYKALGATVIGVSHDPLDTLQKFSVSDCRSKFPVAADTNQDVMREYDAILAQHPQYANRTSYVIAPDGTIIYTYTSLDPSQHVQNTLTALKTWEADHAPKQ